MKLIILLTTAYLGYIGYFEYQWYGLATGIISPLFIGTSLLILLDQGNDMSIHYRMRKKQRINGAITLLASGICVFIGGWQYGWLGVILGYFVGATISSFLGKETVNSLK
jgi:hypothetical protein